MPLTPSVGTGQIITPAWGNEIRDRTWQQFANKAALDTWLAPDGAFAWVLDVKRPYTRIAGVWCRNPDYGAFSGNTSGSDVIVPHLCGTTPAGLAIVPLAGFLVFWVPGQTATTFTVRCYSGTGTGVPNATPVQLRWIAYPS